MSRPALTGVAAALALSSLVVLGAVPAPETGYRVEPVAAGVYAAVPARPVGWLPAATNLFIVNDDDVVVVDASPSPSGTRAALDALRAITDKPVSHVISTHGHDDHVLGNAVYRAAFPQATFIMHAKAQDALLALRGERRRVPGEITLDQLLQMIATGRGPLGEPLTDRSRSGVLADVAQLQTYAEPVTAEQWRPTLTIEAPLTLTRGTRTIEIRPVGPAHTEGDLIVFLPAERVVAIGDLAGLPFPAVDVGTSNLKLWPSAIDAALALDPAVIVPGHGGPMSRSVVELQRDLLASIATQVSSPALRDKNLGELMAQVNVRSFRTALAGTDPFLDLLFENQFLTSAVRAARRVR